MIDAHTIHDQVSQYLPYHIDIPRLTLITRVSDFDIVSIYMVHIKTSLSLQVETLLYVV